MNCLAVQCRRLPSGMQYISPLNVYWQGFDAKPCLQIFWLPNLCRGTGIPVCDMLRMAAQKAGIHFLCGFGEMGMQTELTPHRTLGSWLG